MITDIWTEAQERDECPECEHPWYLHAETQCTQVLCLCQDGKRPLWALPPDQYEALSNLGGLGDSTGTSTAQPLTD